MAARSYTKLKKEISKEQFDKLAIQITEKYISKGQEYSQADVAKDFDVTADCVREMMDYAIVEALVTRFVADKVSQKAAANQQKKHPKAGESSKRHHKQLMDQREEKLTRSLSESNVYQIAKNALQNPENDFEKTQKYFKLESKRHMYKIFKRSIEESILNKEDAIKLIDLIWKRYPMQSTRDYWNEVWNKRTLKEKENRQLTFGDLLG